MFGSWELCISLQNNTFRFAVCRLNPKNKKVEVSKAFQLDIPEEFWGSKDASGNALTGLIRTALKDNKINIKSYRMCISDRDIITRVVKLPKMELRDLKSFMKMSIFQYFPIKPDDYYFDFKVQSINPEDEKVYYNLLLVAVPKLTIEFYSQILFRCGLKPKNISIYSDVVSDLFLYMLESEDLVIMDIGYNHTEFIMLEGKSIFINSVINYAIPKSKSYDEANYLKSLSEEQLGEDFVSTLETLENYINFFSSRHHGKNIGDIFFIGEGTLLTPIYALEKSLNIKVKTGRDLLDSRLIITTMPDSMRQNFYPERYCSCFGLLVGGSKK